ncbi:MAG: NifB/NifX family molybdenum-iron cluster-binding protein [Candidatus Hodarchaeota archaeon]
MSRIAIPVDNQADLESVPSAHFGHTAFFTLVEVNDENGNIVKQEFVANPPHEMGGCMMPVRLLVDNKADFIVVGGIGMRPLMGFMQMGIKVKHNSEGYGTVGEIIKNFDALPVIEQSTCQH